MKNLLQLFACLPLLASSLGAQSRAISKGDYDKAYRFAVSETNTAFPFIFTVTTELIENDKVLSTVTEVDERESAERERITRTTVADGKTTRKHQISVGFGKVYCSDDGVIWKGPSQYECYGPVSFYGRRDPESIEYSVTEKSVKGVKVKVYSEYSVFPVSPRYEKRNFREKLLTIDSRGFFISIVSTEGTLDPKTTTLIRKQSWDANTKIKPVVAPTN
jgi:hypothetical protein